MGTEEPSGAPSPGAHDGARPNIHLDDRVVANRSLVCDFVIHCAYFERIGALRHNCGSRRFDGAPWKFRKGKFEDKQRMARIATTWKSPAPWLCWLAPEGRMVFQVHPPQGGAGAPRGVRRGGRRTRTVRPERRRCLRPAPSQGGGRSPAAERKGEETRRASGRERVGSCSFAAGRRHGHC